MQTAEQKNVIDAINSLNRRVTAADIASKTGLPLHVANSELNRVAADVGGHLEVSTTGDVVYKFNPGFENTYAAKGFQKTLETVGKKAFEIGYFLLRISFGVMLIVSFLAVIVLIVIAMIALSRLGSDGDDGGDGGGFNFGFFDYMILRDLLFWGTWSYPDPYIDYNRPASRRPQQKGNFFFNVFSFLFGDGNPNSHIEERKWQMIAEVIRNNQGVVTAEQLAPYTGADPGNEDNVLPVLVRFDGKPEVTETGNIVYVFPSMQVRGTLSAFPDGFVPNHLREYPWQFTTVPIESLTPVFLLAGVTFLGSWWLLIESSKLFVLHAMAPFIVALTVYGTLFLVVPAIRYGILQLLNGRIADRNAKREGYAVVVQNRPGELAKKFEEASNYQIGQRTVSASNLAYTTERDNLDQEFEEHFGTELQPPALSNNPQTHSKPQHTKRGEPPRISHDRTHDPNLEAHTEPHHDNVIYTNDPQQELMERYQREQQEKRRRSHQEGEP